jgi:hypothetical protein
MRGKKQRFQLNSLSRSHAGFLPESNISGVEWPRRKVFCAQNKAKELL